MPKIVITEVDNTSPGINEYSNFSVVVPGFVKNKLSDDAAIFDDNGIYECSNQADFVENIGYYTNTFKVKRTVAAATAPTVSVILKLVSDSKTIPIPEEENEALYAYYFTDCDFKVNGSEAAKKDLTISYYSAIQFNNALDMFNKYSTYEEAVQKNINKALNAALKEEFVLSGNLNLYLGTANETGIVGKLKTADTKFSAASGIQTSTAAHPKVSGEETTESGATLEFVEAVEYPSGTYYLIPADAEGVDGKTVLDNIIHYGNQIAYELLGMGYTVLYKRMTENYLEDLLANEETREGILDQLFEEVDSADTVKSAIKASLESLSGQLTNTQIENTWKTIYGKLIESGVIEDKAADDIYNLAEAADGKYRALAQLENPEFWECLKDKAAYDFRYIVTGTFDHCTEANKCIINIAHHNNENTDPLTNGRGDCIALVDVGRECYAQKTQADAIPYMAYEAANYKSKYAAIFAPCVTYSFTDKNYNNSTFPGYFHYLACAAKSSETYNEWYANAGFTRGISKYTINKLGCKFGEVAIQALEPRQSGVVAKGKAVLYNADGTSYIETTVPVGVAINLIVKIKNGYYLWGNRTAFELDSNNLVASHFLNIRQLCTTIKKQVYTTCRRLTFDPNSELLWLNFRSLITPTLELMKSDQGIRDYKIIPRKTDKKATLKAAIRIVPIEAVEDFEIELSLEDSLSNGISVEATE